MDINSITLETAFFASGIALLIGVFIHSMRMPEDFNKKKEFLNTKIRERIQITPNYFNVEVDNHESDAPPSPVGQ